jgi:hypothetical protein
LALRVKHRSKNINKKRGNLLTSGIEGNINKIPTEDILKSKGHCSRIVSTRKRGMKYKSEWGLKSESTLSSKFLINVIIPLCLLTSIFVIASCDNSDELISPGNDFVYIPDNQFESILIEQNIDTNGVINQKIIQRDALKVTHLDLNLSASNLFIEDLTGIEGFTNLSYLSASGQMENNILVIGGTGKTGQPCSRELIKIRT